MSIAKQLNRAPEGKVTRNRRLASDNRCHALKENEGALAQFEAYRQG